MHGGRHLLFDEGTHDAYLRSQELVPYPSTTSRFPEAHLDDNAIAELRIQPVPTALCPNPSPLQCIISETEEPLLFEGTKVQFSTKAVVGKFVLDNLSILEPGMELPNGTKIIEIIFIRR